MKAKHKLKAISFFTFMMFGFTSAFATTDAENEDGKITKSSSKLQPTLETAFQRYAFSTPQAAYQYREENGHNVLSEVWPDFIECFYFFTKNGLLYFQSRLNQAEEIGHIDYDESYLLNKLVFLSDKIRWELQLSSTAYTSQFVSYALSDEIPFPIGLLTPQGTVKPIGATPLSSIQDDLTEHSLTSDKKKHDKEWADACRDFDWMFNDYSYAYVPTFELLNQEEQTMILNYFRTTGNTTDGRTMARDLFKMDDATITAAKTHFPY